MASLQDQKPWKVEYAKSSRSSCKTCKTPIDKETLRLGKMVHATQFDGFMPTWNHAECILKKANQITSTGDVEGLELIRWEDQQKIRKHVEGAQQAETNAFTDMECSVEVSQTSRATCRLCSQKILKGEVRISTKPESQGPRSLAWHHANCYLESSPSIQLEKLIGWKTLAPSDQATVHALVKKAPSTTKSGTKVEEQDDNELKQSTSKAGAKRKKDVGGNRKSKVAKADGDVSKSRGASARNNNGA